MFLEGKILPIRRASAGLQAMFAALVQEEVVKLYNPLRAFLDSLDGCAAEDRAAALSAFISSGGHKEFPEIYRLVAQNSLGAAKFLVKHLIPDYGGEVTEENKALFLKAIQLHHANPEMERILEIRDGRRYASACKQD